MAKPIKFKQASGLTAYALTCGYIQSARVQRGDVETIVRLSHSGGNCYTVTAHQYGGKGQLHYTATESIGHARDVWGQWVNRLFAAELSAVKADKRYSFAREFAGEREQLWVARFEGEWLGKSDTKQGAQLLAYIDIAQRHALISGLSFFPFDGGRWHAWPTNGVVVLSDEDNKELREFATLDDTVNWLFVHDHKDAARALNKHAKGLK